MDNNRETEKMELCCTRDEIADSTSLDNKINTQDEGYTSILAIQILTHCSMT